MTRFVREIDQRRWSDDVNRHARLVDLRAGMTSPRASDLIDRQIAEIEARWPRHFKCRRFIAQPAPASPSQEADRG